MTWSAGDTLNAADLNGGFQRETVVFTSSGTFSKASYPWARYARVRLVGGGGGGGNSNNTTASQICVGGGGGGGGYAEKLIAVSAMSASESVTVGAGGAGATAGSVDVRGGTGGSSSFGSHVSASGGTGGNTQGSNAPINAFGEPGSGGTASSADFGVTGGAGDYGLTVVNSGGRVLGPRGGDSHLGYGGHAIYTAASSSGRAGQLYGGGGGGACADVSTTGQAGGVGAAGIVIVELFGGSGSS
jgi:hypothetical protein